MLAGAERLEKLIQDAADVAIDHTAAWRVIVQDEGPDEDPHGLLKGITALQAEIECGRSTETSTSRQQTGALSIRLTKSAESGDSVDSRFDQPDQGSLFIPGQEADLPPDGSSGSTLYAPASWYLARRGPDREQQQ